MIYCAGADLHRASAIDGVTLVTMVFATMMHGSHKPTGRCRAGADTVVGGVDRCAVRRASRPEDSRRTHAAVVGLLIIAVGIDSRSAVDPARRDLHHPRKRRYTDDRAQPHSQPLSCATDGHELRRVAARAEAADPSVSNHRVTVDAEVFGKSSCCSGRSKRRLHRSPTAQVRSRGEPSLARAPTW